MTTQETVKPKKVYQSDDVVNKSIRASIRYVLTSPALNPSNTYYITRMHEKVMSDKRLTTNEVAGLAKIERALKRVANGTYKVQTV